MSPKNKNKLRIIRNKLDKLDDSMLLLIKKRTNLVTEVLKLKEFKYQIVDKERIKKILIRVKKKSLEHKIDPKITNKIWINMIKSYIEFENRNFKKNSYLLCGGSFFSTNISCLRVEGLYFLTLSFTFAFSPPDGFFT